MKLDPHDEDLMRRFLLGSVTPEERDLVEERFMSDEDYYQSLCALEGELNLDYLHGKLPAVLQDDYKTAVLDVPSRRRHVDALRDFTVALESARRATEPVDWRQVAKVQPLRAAVGTIFDFVAAYRWAVATAVVAVLALVVVWGPGGVGRAPEETLQPGAAVDAGSSMQAPTGAGSAPVQGAVQPLTLVPGATRAALGQGNIFVIAAGTRDVELTTTVSNGDIDATSVTATLRNVDVDAPLLMAKAAVVKSAAGIDLRVRVAASLLVRGDYLLFLTPEDGSRRGVDFPPRFFTIDE